MTAPSMRRVNFNDAYKEWRNRARCYSRESIFVSAINVLSEPSSDPETELGKAPWLTLLMVKWVCQDRYRDGRRSQPISRRQLDDLRQRLWEIPNRLVRGQRDDLPGRLFMRQLIRPQLGFQRRLTTGFAREAALLAAQRDDHPLRKLFKGKTGLDVREFIDLSLATYSRIFDGEREIPDTWFTSIRTAYATEVISSFQKSVARTLPELVAFCRSLPDANRKVASEYFEFPVLSRYPFVRTDDGMICWHPAVFYRGMESFVHSVLSEEGHEYMQRFGRLFERHVVAEAMEVPTQFFDEDKLRGWIAAETKVPDGLLSFPRCNIFIESKARLFHEPEMAIGSSELFAHKTKAIRKAVQQAWATSVSLRKERHAPDTVLDTDADYLLIVTNKELGASRGTVLASMYPDGTLKYPNGEAERLLPLDHIYVLAIDDFERLTNAAADGHIDVPNFLASCVDDDRNPETALHLFEQHLDRQRVPQQFSQVVEMAVDDSFSRLKRAVSN